MCGISGFWIQEGLSADAGDALLQAMNGEIIRRGPDDEGRWVDAAAGVGLGQRRLAIMDLSPAGHQPMESANGRYVVTYNGELYGFQDLRDKLAAGGQSFRGHSDTEVLVEAIAAWGLDAVLPQIKGMFAIALWDKQEKTLSLVRDRVGIKPLYVFNKDGVIGFASQSRCFRHLPGWDQDIDKTALDHMLHYGYVPSGSSIWQGVTQLKPGHQMVFATDGSAVESCWWDLAKIADVASRNRTDADGVLADLDPLLSQIVGEHMLSDVPLGAFLSGGIDSSTVVALMQAQSDVPVRTFSIGFDEGAYNEAAHAKAIARHLGTNHTEFILGPDDSLDLVPQLPEFYDEPFADASQLPTLMVSRITKEHVTVALSGDGGDEIFGGYTRYQWASRFKKIFDQLPAGLRKAGGAGIGVLSPAAWDSLFKLVPENKRPSLAGDRIHKLARMLKLEGLQDVYPGLVTAWPLGESLVLGQDGDCASPTLPDGLSYLEQMQLEDELTYLPDDILAKVDRASMAWSLESRVPLLDHRLIEFGWTLDDSLKIRDGQMKWPLRQILYKHVPREMVDRPKQGFAVPIDQWLRGPLKDWAGDLLSENRLKSRGILNPAPIRQKWDEHQSGRRNWQYALWYVLMFEAWLNHID